MAPVRSMIVSCTRRAGAPISIERLRSRVPFADIEPQPVEAKRKGVLFSYRRQGRGHTSASVLRAHLHILKLRWIRESKVCMPERLSVLPGDQVEAVPLVQPREPERLTHPLGLRGLERRDADLRRR